MEVIRQRWQRNCFKQKNSLGSTRSYGHCAASECRAAESAERIIIKAATYRALPESQTRF